MEFLRLLDHTPPEYLTQKYLNELVYSLNKQVFVGWVSGRNHIVLANKWSPRNPTSSSLPKDVGFRSDFNRLRWIFIPLNPTYGKPNIART
jgi:hypothetical protein